MIPFNNAVHQRYARNSFSPGELEFARALDNLNTGVWLRNPVRGEGYGIPLPVKVGSSSTFYPDFIWWTGDLVLAIDPTGSHIFEAKVRGKLLTLDTPAVVLVAKGKLAADWSTTVETDGYTVVRARKGRQPAPEYFGDLNTALRRVAGLKIDEPTATPQSHG
jgi:type III restriction enzyme